MARIKGVRLITPTPEGEQVVLISFEDGTESWMARQAFAQRYEIDVHGDEVWITDLEGETVVTCEEAIFTDDEVRRLKQMVIEVSPEEGRECGRLMRETMKPRTTHAGLFPAGEKKLMEAAAEEVEKVLGKTGPNEKGATGHQWCSGAYCRTCGTELDEDNEMAPCLGRDDRAVTQLAGCLVAAEGNAVGNNDAEEGDYGWSPAFEAVKKLWDESEGLANTLRKMREEAKGRERRMKNLDGSLEIAVEDNQKQRRNLGKAFVTIKELRKAREEKAEDTSARTTKLAEENMACWDKIEEFKETVARNHSVIEKQRKHNTAQSVENERLRDSSSVKALASLEQRLGSVSDRNRVQESNIDILVQQKAGLRAALKQANGRLKRVSDLYNDARTANEDLIKKLEESRPSYEKQDKGAVYSERTERLIATIEKLEAGMESLRRENERLEKYGENCVAEMTRKDALNNSLRNHIEEMRNRSAIVPKKNAWFQIDVRCPNCQAEASVEVQGPDKKEEVSDGKGRSDSNG